MQKIESKSTVFWTFCIATVITIIVTPLIINDIDARTIMIVLLIGVFTGAFTLGIQSEMKKIFGETWKKVFLITIGFIYLIGSGIIPVTLLFSADTNNPWKFKLFSILFLLPVIYFSLFLFRKYSNRTANKV